MSAGESSPALSLISSEIAREGAIPFARFMALALYEPGVGYYARPDTTTGRAGDFSTSPDVSPDFGRRLALQVAELQDRLGGGAWRLIEIGPGRGLLACDVLEGLAAHAPGALDALCELLLVELNPALQILQAERLGGLENPPPTRWISAPAEHVRDQLPAIVIANELLDALPFHVVARGGEGSLVERCVALSDREGEAAALRFVAREPSDPRLAERARLFGLCEREGQVAEICLAMEQLIEELIDPLGARAAILVDYGHEAERLSDEEHSEGSAVAYFRHRVVHDLLARPGEQDLTAHVNWSHAEWAARRAGFEVAGRASQERFLLALGIIDDLVRLGEGEESRHARSRRLAARSLVLGGPAAGRRFQVLVLLRGVEGPVRGLGEPAPPTQGGVPGRRR